MSSTKIPDEIIIHIIQFFPTNKKNKSINKKFNNQIFTQYELLIKNLLNTSIYLEEKTTNKLQLIEKHNSFTHYRYELSNNVKLLKSCVNKLLKEKTILLKIVIFEKSWENSFDGYKIWLSNKKLNKYNKSYYKHKYLKKIIKEQLQIEQNNNYNFNNFQCSKGSTKFTGKKTKNYDGLIINVYKGSTLRNVHTIPAVPAKSFNIYLRYLN